MNWTSVAEDQIRQAQADGQFDHLPGFGQPIPGIDDPYDENWWVKEKLRREQISALPPALEIARDKERTLAAVVTLTSEMAVRRELSTLNERIRRAHFSCTWGTILHDAAGRYRGICAAMGKVNRRLDLTHNEKSEWQKI